MGESELHEPHERKIAKRKALLGRLGVVNAVFIVAIIALAGISISLFGLANHYHDSKYSAQYELVTTLAESISFAKHGILTMISGDVRDYERYGASVHSQTLLMQALNAAVAIDVMYPRESKESSAFGFIERAMLQTEHVVASYESQLYNAFQNDRTYEANATVNTLFANATLEMSVLADLILAGVDHSRDSLESPYSLVKRMDLKAIQYETGQLEETDRELRMLMPG